MSATESTKRNYNKEAALWAVLVGFVIALATIVSVGLAYGAHRLVRRLTRLERIVILVSVVAAIAISPEAVVVEQVVWLAGLVGLSSTPSWPVPWLGILVMGALYFVLFDLLFASELGGKFRLRIVNTIKRGEDVFSKSSLVPKSEDKARVKVAAPPGGSIGTAHLHHSLSDDPLNADERGIYVALDRNNVPVRITEREFGMHGVLLGSTGSGKTITIQAIASALMDLGWSGLLLDLKEDIAPGGLRDFCRDYVAHHALPYQQMALSDPNSEFWLNPLAGMDPDFARDTILSLTTFDDSYWQNLNKKMLGQLVNLCYDAHEIDPVSVPYPTISGIGRILESGDLRRSTTKMRALVVNSGLSGAEERYSTLADPDPDSQKSAAGFGAKLTQMYDTVAGRTVLSPGNGRLEIDVTAEGLTYVGLDSTGKPDLAKLISSAVLQRMSVFAAQRTIGLLKKGRPRFLIVDEASVADRAILQALLSKARGAGVSVLLCTQGPDDWIDKNGDDWSMLVQNVNVGIVMSQGSPKAAEMCAEFIGSTEHRVLSQQVVDGEVAARGTVSQRVDYLVQPHELRQLGTGDAILRIGKPSERVTWMHVVMRDPTARPHRAGI